MMMLVYKDKVDVVVIGGGLVGFVVCNELEKCGVDYVLFEFSDDVGGCVCIDIVDGFLFD